MKVQLEPGCSQSVCAKGVLRDPPHCGSNFHHYHSPPLYEKHTYSVHVTVLPLHVQIRRDVIMTSLPSTCNVWGPRYTCRIRDVSADSSVSYTKLRVSRDLQFLAVIGGLFLADL